MMISAKYLGLTANQLAKIASELDTEKEVLCARIDELCADKNRLLSIQLRSAALIESLLHCMSDMDKGIGCDGCKSNIVGECNINQLLKEYELCKFELGVTL